MSTVCLALTACVGGRGSSIDVDANGAGFRAGAGQETSLQARAAPAGTNRSLKAADRYFARQATQSPLPIGSAAAAGHDYRVAPLDILQVSVFQVDELNRKVRVSPSGQISLPLVGAVAAAGMTVADLERDLARRLGERYLQSPQVSVFVEDSTYNRITVEGAVKKPGVFPNSGSVTLVQAIAMAGGTAWVADPDGIVVFRTANGKRMAARFDLPDIRNGDVPDPVLVAGDIVVVPESGWRSGLTDWNALVGALPSPGLFTLL